MRISWLWRWPTIVCLHPFGFDDVEETHAVVEDPIAGTGRVWFRGKCRRCGRTVHWGESNA